MAKISVSDAAAYAKMLVNGIAGVGNGADGSAVNEAIDNLASAAPTGSTFDLDDTAEADYQAARKAAQDAVSGG